MLKTHSLSISHSHTLSITLDMLNNFYFHLYAQKSLVIAKMARVFFSWEPALGLANAQVRVWMWMKPLQFSAITVTFEHRDENKSCSACPEDQLKPF